ncbi:hypothetical protein RND81_08G130600 [Saponaria officinalis]|uniref:Polyprotein n=1 Tax=Saponaria officinalis TaxID=3572 RepID=A0AAW1J874_SAPOF
MNCVKDMIGKSNGAQLYGVHKKLTAFSQGDDSIAGYFTKIKSIWDEIDAMGLNPNCTCTCTCGAAEKRAKFQQDQRVVQFLMGLNDTFNVIRRTILMQTPLRSLASVYSNLVQEEKQREIHNFSQIGGESASFYAKNHRGNVGTGSVQYNRHDYRGKSFYTPDSRKPITCNYCKKPGHTVDKCYKLQNNRNKRFANNVQNDGILGAYENYTSGHDMGADSNSSGVPPDLLYQLKNFLQKL